MADDLTEVRVEDATPEAGSRFCRCVGARGVRRKVRPARGEFVQLPQQGPRWSGFRPSTRCGSTASVTVKAGEPVCFVVADSGKTKHEFVVGRAIQDEHEMEMSSGSGMESGGMEMGGMPDVELKPGETWP